MLKNFPIFFWGANCSQIYFSHYLTTTHQPEKSLLVVWSRKHQGKSLSYISALNFTCNRRENIEPRKRGRKFCSIILLLTACIFSTLEGWKCFFGLRIFEARELVFFPFSRNTWRIFWLPKSWIDEWQLSVILQLEKKTIFRKKSWFGTAAGFGNAPYFWTFKKMPSRLLPIKLYFSLSIRAWMQSIEASPIS